MTTDWNQAIAATPKTSGNYFKPEKDKAIVVRVVSPPVFGYEYWNNENKPVRSKEEPTNLDDCPKNDKGICEVKFFWAFVIWNYEEERIQIWEVTQKSIMSQLEAYIQDEEYGIPQRYDLKVTRKGESKETKYTVMARPPKELEEKPKEAAETTDVNLDALFTSEDPFGKAKEVEAEKPKEDIGEEDSPFQREQF